MNMGLILQLNLLKQLVFILLCLFLICVEYELESFGATSDEIRLTFIRRRAIYGADLEVLAVRTHPMCCAAGI